MTGCVLAANNERGLLERAFQGVLILTLATLLTGFSASVTAVIVGNSSTRKKIGGVCAGLTIFWGAIPALLDKPDERAAIHAHRVRHWDEACAADVDLAGASSAVALILADDGAGRKAVGARQQAALQRLATHVSRELVHCAAGEPPEKVDERPAIPDEVYETASNTVANAGFGEPPPPPSGIADPARTKAFFRSLTEKRPALKREQTNLLETLRVIQVRPPPPDGP